MESSRKIVDIIGVIDSIAFQTNILALKVAVEAASAGAQTQGVEQIRIAIARMAPITQQNAALAGQTVSVAHALQDKSAHMFQTVGIFHLKVCRVPDSVSAGQLLF